MNINLENAYTMFKKDVRIISQNEPLLFVHGPPVFIRVAVKDEESTSVFVPNGEEIEQEEVEVRSAPVNPSVVKKINRLGEAFQRQVYKPLKFILANETLTGAISKVDGDTVFIDLDKEDLQVAVKVSEIEEIMWRGKPFQED